MYTKRFTLEAVVLQFLLAPFLIVYQGNMHLLHSKKPKWEFPAAAYLCCVRHYFSGYKATGSPEFCVSLDPSKQLNYGTLNAWSFF
jgi:hypothetical protein